MKRRHYEKSTEQAAWEADKKACFYCGGKGLYDNEHKNNFGGLTTHHCQRRSGCFKPHQDWPENLIRVCWAPCHDIVEGWEHSRQLALKWQRDRCGHESLAAFLERWLKVRDGDTIRAPQRVTAEEVEQFLPAKESKEHAA